MKPGEICDVVEIGFVIDEEVSYFVGLFYHVLSEKDAYPMVQTEHFKDNIYKLSSTIKVGSV